MRIYSIKEREGGKEEREGGNEREREREEEDEEGWDGRAGAKNQVLTRSDSEEWAPSA